MYYCLDAYSDAKSRSKALAALGLALLRQGRYDNAVSHFVDCDYSIHGQWPEALSGHDIALYGGLCALASLSRANLKKKNFAFLVLTHKGEGVNFFFFLKSQIVLDNEHFKRFLELRPTVSKLVRGFYDNEYGIVMSGLNALKKELIVCFCVHVVFVSEKGGWFIHIYAKKKKTTWANKIHFVPMWNDKFFFFKKKSPYSAMDMKKMAKAFNVSLPEMEQELSTCVSDGHIQAKIDSHSKIVYASLQNKRNKLFDEVLQLGDEFATEMRGVLLRMSLQENNVVVSQTREMLQEMEMMGETDDPKNGLVGAMAGMGRRVLGFGPGGPSRGGGAGGKQPRRG
ncbi:COP9 signalosome complex subunit [Reticulomyxa filosa]|uniref:COP9 signalosome complex subunit n=1 Tax=Reticulomyxa filosa TaxID=46433 RepID=X6MPG1_RETFI|nr:COP9 signalosome complex subunit [Reticulomyxa filosa]|eukprot:ETO14960.1 COP9 signalosome complex subunit [Reticulomyxa filosa]